MHSPYIYRLTQGIRPSDDFFIQFLQCVCKIRFAIEELLVLVCNRIVDALWLLKQVLWLPPLTPGGQSILTPPVVSLSSCILNQILGVHPINRQISLAQLIEKFLENCDYLISPTLCQRARQLTCRCRSGCPMTFSHGLWTLCCTHLAVLSWSAQWCPWWGFYALVCAVWLCTGCCRWWSKSWRAWNCQRISHRDTCGFSTQIPVAL